MCSASHLSRYGRYARAALIDADPELHTRPRFNGCVSFGHFLLHREHASDSTPKPSLDVSMMLPPYFATIRQGSGPGDALRSRTVAPSSAPMSVLKPAPSGLSSLGRWIEDMPRATAISLNCIRRCWRMLSRRKIGEKRGINHDHSAVQAQLNWREQHRKLLIP